MIGKQHILLVVLVFPGCQGETCVSMRVPRFGFCHENKELSDWMRKWEWKHSWVGVLRMILPWVEILTLHGLMQHIYKPQQTWWVHWYFHDLEFFRPGFAHFLGPPSIEKLPDGWFSSYSPILCGSKLHVCVCWLHISLVHCPFFVGSIPISHILWGWILKFLPEPPQHFFVINSQMVVS